MTCIRVRGVDRVDIESDMDKEAVRVYPKLQACQEESSPNPRSLWRGRSLLVNLHPELIR